MASCGDLECYLFVSLSVFEKGLGSDLLSSRPKGSDLRQSDRPISVTSLTKAPVVCWNSLRWIDLGSLQALKEEKKGRKPLENPMIVWGEQPALFWHLHTETHLLSSSAI